MNTTSQGIKLDGHTQERLKALAQLRDRTPHYLMKTAIEGFLDKEEAYEQEKNEDLHRWERYELTGEAIAHERVAVWLQALAKGETSPRPQ